MEEIIYEDVLKWTGEIGVYQIVIFLYGCLLSFISVEPLYMNFIGYRMDHWCEVPELANLSFETQKYVAIPYNSDSSGDTNIFDSCRMFELNYSQILSEGLWNFSRNDNAPTKGCHGWVFDQSVYEDNIVNEWELVCGKSWQIDLVSTMTMVGSFLGAMGGGASSDRFGRARSIAFGLVLKTASNVLSTVAPNYIVFIIARFFIGFGSSFPYVVCFVLIVENAGVTHRPWMGMAFSIMYSVGFAFIPAFAYACRDWRNLQIIMTAPNVIFLVTAWFVPESPRWLVSQGRLKEADAGIRLMADVNNNELPDEYDIANIKKDDESSRKATALDLLKTPKIRKYTLIQAVIWFSLTVIYFALSLNAGALAGDIYLNTALLGLVEVPSGIVCFLAMKTKLFGRKKTVALSAFIGGIAGVICVPLILLVGADSMSITVLAMIGKAGVTTAFNGVYIFTTEIYPTEVRNVGLGTCVTVAQLGSIVAPYVGGLFGEFWPPLPSLIFGIIGTLSGLLTLLLPETFGKSLPDTIEEFEAGGYKQQSPKEIIHPLENGQIEQNGAIPSQTAQSKDIAVEGNHPFEVQLLTTVKSNEDSFSVEF